MKKLQRKIFIFLLKSSESSVIYENLEIGFREQNFGRQEVIFFKNFDVTYFNKNEKKRIKRGKPQSIQRVSDQFEFTAYGLHTNHPPAWILILQLRFYPSAFDHWVALKRAVLV